MKTDRISGEVGQAMVEYAILVFFCVLLFGFQANLLVDVLNDYAQGFYFILQQPYP